MEEHQHIDELLERYLGLLDEYTQLRQSLSQLQADVFHNIARANFAGERGMRYGQDHYDERMQATRLLSIMQNENQASNFTVVTVPEEEKEGGGMKDETYSNKDPDKELKSIDDEEKPAEKKRRQNNNPLQWFGLFTPMPLRTAQTHSVKSVEDVVPRLVSVNAEMANVEIEVRRARKRRAKAEIAEKNAGQAVTATQP